MISKAFLAFALTTCSLAAMAIADPRTPHDSFGAIPVATFGGTGIPNTAMAITEFGANVCTGPFGDPPCAPRVIMGMTATARYSENEAVTNNGAAIYSAAAGPDLGVGAGRGAPYATWNFDYYLSDGLVPFTPAPATPDFFYRFLIDIDPTFDTDKSLYAVGPWFAAPPAATSFVLQDSFNLGQLDCDPGAGFAACNGTIPGGEYGLILQAYDTEKQNVQGEVGVLVRVKAVPEPGSLALIGLGLAGLALSRRRKTQ